MFKKTSPQDKPGENGAQQAQQSNQQQQPPGTPVRKLNLKTATREEMIEFIKQYNAHTKQVEARSREVYENYKSTFMEKERINAEYNRVRSGCETIANNLALEDPNSVAAAMIRDVIGSNGTTPVVDKESEQKFVALIQGIRELRRQNEENKKAINLLKSALSRNLSGIDAKQLQQQPIEQVVKEHQIQQEQILQEEQIKQEEAKKLQEQQERERELERERERKREEEREQEKEKERVREKEREQEKEKERLRELEREQEKEKERIREKEREQERKREKERELEREKEREREKKREEEREQEKKREEEREKEREQEREKEKAREKEREQEKEKEKERELEREKEREEHQKVLDEKKEIEEERESLKAKVNKLQQLVSKAREQLEVKNKLLTEKSDELTKAKSDLEGSDAITEECRIRLLEAESQREKLEDSMRTFHREATQRQEALEERALTAESELIALRRDFDAYKERASLAQSQSASVEDFIQFQSENEMLKTRVGEAEKLNQSYEYQLEEKADQIRKSAEEADALREEISAAEIQHKKAVSELEKEFSEKLSNLAKSLEEYKERYEGKLDEAHKEAEALRANLRKAEEELKTEKGRRVVDPKDKKVGGTKTLTLGAMGSDVTSSTDAKKEEPKKVKTFPQIDLSRNIEGEGNGKKPAVPGGEHAITNPATTPGTTNGQSGAPLFIMAKVQEQKDSTIAQLKAQNASLEQRISALEEESHYHEAQEALLREQLRKTTAVSSSSAKTQPGPITTSGQSYSQGGINIEYLKNIIIKYMETDEHDRLIPVISTIFGMTPEEVNKINNTRKARLAKSSYGIKGLVTMFSQPSSTQQSYSPQIPTSHDQK